MLFEALLLLIFGKLTLTLSSSTPPGLEFIDLLELDIAVVFVTLLFELRRMPLGDLLGCELLVCAATYVPGMVEKLEPL